MLPIRSRDYFLIDWLLGVQVTFEELIAEPHPTIFSFDSIWTNSYKVYPPPPTPFSLSRLCVHVCVLGGGGVHPCVCIHVRVCLYVGVHVCVCIHVFVHSCVCVCARARVYAEWGLVCIHARARVCV